MQIKSKKNRQNEKISFFCRKFEDFIENSKSYDN